jgi:hypothetical protein
LTHLPHGVILPAELVWIFGSGEGLSAARRRVAESSPFPRVWDLSRAGGHLGPLKSVFLGRIFCAFPRLIGGCVVCSVAEIPGATGRPTAVCGPRSIVPWTLWKAITSQPVGDLLVKISSRRRVDPRSIGSSVSAGSPGLPGPWTVWRKRSSIPTPGPLLYVYSRFLGGLARQRGQTNPFLQWKSLSEQNKPY